jgi:hypothetical protein
LQLLQQLYARSAVSTKLCGSSLDEQHILGFSSLSC